MSRFGFGFISAILGNVINNPSFVGAGAIVSSTANATLNIHTDTIAGDLLILVAETSDNYVPELNAPWEKLLENAIGSSTTETRLNVYVCVAPIGFTAPTISDAGDHIVGTILTFRDLDVTRRPILNIWGTNTNTASTSQTSSAVTTTEDKCLIIDIFTNSTDTATSQTSGYTNASLNAITEIFDGNSTQGNGGGIGISSGKQSVKGSSGSTAATLATSSTSAKGKIALAPHSRFGNANAALMIITPGVFQYPYLITSGNNIDWTPNTVIKTAIENKIGRAVNFFAGEDIAAAFINGAGYYILYIAVSSYGTMTSSNGIVSQFALYSKDGLTWDDVVLPAGVAWEYFEPVGLPANCPVVMFNNTVKGNVCEYYITSDLENWTKGEYPVEMTSITAGNREPFPLNEFSIAYSPKNGILGAMSRKSELGKQDDYPVIWYTTDFLNWSEVPFPNIDSDLNALHYAGDRFFITYFDYTVGEEFLVYTTTNMTSITLTDLDINYIKGNFKYANGVWIVSEDVGPPVPYISYNGINFVPANAGVYYDQFEIGGVALAIDYNNTYATTGYYEEATEYTNYQRSMRFSKPISINYPAGYQSSGFFTLDASKVYNRYGAPVVLRKQSDASLEVFNFDGVNFTAITDTDFVTELYKRYSTGTTHRSLYSGHPYTYPSPNLIDGLRFDSVGIPIKVLLAVSLSGNVFYSPVGEDNSSLTWRQLITGAGNILNVKAEIPLFKNTKVLPASLLVVSSEFGNILHYISTNSTSMNFNNTPGPIESSGEDLTLAYYVADWDKFLFGYSNGVISIGKFDTVSDDEYFTTGLSNVIDATSNGSDTVVVITGATGTTGPLQVITSGGTSRVEPSWANGAINKVVYGNGLWLIKGSSPDKIWSATNPTGTWTQRLDGTTNPVDGTSFITASISFTNGYFFACGVKDNGGGIYTPKLLRSANGSTWTDLGACGITQTGIAFSDIRYFNGEYYLGTVIVAELPETKNLLIKSSDLTTWKNAGLTDVVTASDSFEDDYGIISLVVANIASDIVSGDSYNETTKEDHLFWDDFSGNAGALNGRTPLIGGANWSTTGAAATNVQIDGNSNLIQTSSSPTPGYAIGRFVKPAYGTFSVNTQLLDPSEPSDTFTILLSTSSNMSTAKMVEITYNNQSCEVNLVDAGVSTKTMSYIQQNDEIIGGNSYPGFLAINFLNDVLTVNYNSNSNYLSYRTRDVNLRDYIGEYIILKTTNTTAGWKNISVTNNRFYPESMFDLLIYYNDFSSSLNDIMKLPSNTSSTLTLSGNKLNVSASNSGAGMILALGYKTRIIIRVSVDITNKSGANFRFGLRDNAGWISLGFFMNGRKELSEEDLPEDAYITVTGNGRYTFDYQVYSFVPTSVSVALLSEGGSASCTIDNLMVSEGTEDNSLDGGNYYRLLAVDDFNTPSSAALNGRSLTRGGGTWSTSGAASGIIVTNNGAMGQSSNSPSPGYATTYLSSVPDSFLISFISVGTMTAYPVIKIANTNGSNDKYVELTFTSTEIQLKLVDQVSGTPTYRDPAYYTKELATTAADKEYVLYLAITNSQLRLDVLNTTDQEYMGGIVVYDPELVNYARGQYVTLKTFNAQLKYTRFQVIGGIDYGSLISSGSYRAFATFKHNSEGLVAAPAGGAATWTTPGELTITGSTVGQGAILPLSYMNTDDKVWVSFEVISITNAGSGLIVNTALTNGSWESGVPATSTVTAGTRFTKLITVTSSGGERNLVIGASSGGAFTLKIKNFCVIVDPPQGISPN